MRLIKISPRFQITIPSYLRHIFQTNWVSISSNKNVITLRSIEIQEAKIDEELFEEILKNSAKKHK